MGNKTQALQEITSATVLCRQHPQLLERHGPQLHTLLGLYAMSMNCMEAAEVQFSTVLSVILVIMDNFNLKVLTVTVFRLRMNGSCGHLQI